MFLFKTKKIKQRNLSFHWCHTSNCLNHLLSDDDDCTVAIAPGQKLKSSINAKCSSNYECDGESSICQDTGNVVHKNIREYRIVKMSSHGTYWSSYDKKTNCRANTITKLRTKEAFSFQMTILIESFKKMPWTIPLISLKTKRPPFRPLFKIGVPVNKNRSLLRLGWPILRRKRLRFQDV